MIKITVNRENKYTGTLRQAAEAAARVLRQEAALSVALSFVPESKMREINLKFRGMDKPTDVLSFPNLALERPVSLEVPAIEAKDWPLEAENDGSVFLGDIVICGPVAKRQSKEYGHTEERETAYLFTHGLLHLFGFDHEEERDKRLMREAEEAIIQCTVRS